MSRLKQLLTTEGRGCGNRRGTVKRNNIAVLGQGPGSPSMDTHSNIFELFTDAEIPLGGRS